MPKKSTPLRKTPVQARSAERLARILEAAAQVFEDRGFEGATTEAIAARAGISIGSLYQYFPGKAAVFRALADQFLTLIRGVFDQVMTVDVAKMELGALVGSVVDTYAVMHQTVPGIRALMTQGPFSPEIVAATKELFSEFERRIAEIFRLRNPHTSPEERHRLAAVSVYVFHILSTLSMRGDPAFGDQGSLITEEMKKVLLSYLQEHERTAKDGAKSSIRKSIKKPKK
jgi:AcrR family transcriptional regulator